MTTIAFKDGILAADSAVTASGNWEGSCMKIAKLKPSIFAGFAGALAVQETVFEWIAGGMDRKKIPTIMDGGEDYKWDCLVITPDAVWSLERSFLRSFTQSPYYAIGSGADLALGAMAMGATANQAVEAACKHDIYSRQPITMLKVPKWPRPTMI